MWKNPKMTISQCTPTPISVLIIGLLPFHFRFWQCIYKYNETGLWFPNLVNAGKYACGMIFIVFGYLLAV